MLLRVHLGSSLRRSGTTLVGRGRLRRHRPPARMELLHLDPVVSIRKVGARHLAEGVVPRGHRVAMLLQQRRRTWCTIILTSRLEYASPPFEEGGYCRGSSLLRGTIGAHYTSTAGHSPVALLFPRAASRVSRLHFQLFDDKLGDKAVLFCTKLSNNKKLHGL